MREVGTHPVKNRLRLPVDDLIDGPRLAFERGEFPDPFLAG